MEVKVIEFCPTAKAGGYKILILDNSLELSSDKFRALIVGARNELLYV